MNCLEYLNIYDDDDNAINGRYAMELDSFDKRFIMHQYTKTIFKYQMIKLFLI